MADQDIIFPEDISYGATGGPAFNTDITVTYGGSEQRNANWADPLGRWNVAHGIRTEAQLYQLRAFFYVCRGKLNSFRFKDWGDYQLSDEPIATADGTTDTFQIIKTYSFSGVDNVRTVTRPRASGFVVKVDDVTQTLTTHYTLDAGTGIITFTPGNIPADGEIVTVSGEFDIKARFDTDTLDISLEARGAGGDLIGSWVDIPVQELRRI